MANTEQEQTVYLGWENDEGHCGNDHNILLAVTDSRETAQAKVLACAEERQSYLFSRGEVRHPIEWRQYVGSDGPLQWWTLTVHSERWGWEETRFYVTAEEVSRG